MLKRQPLEKTIDTALHLMMVLMLLLFLSTSCKSPESPTDDPTPTVTRIIITNDFGETLDIYMDGNFQFVMEDEEQKTIEDVSLGQHQTIAKKVGTDIVVGWRDFDIQVAGDYLWTVDDPADINVINNSGYKLQIYMDGTFMFDLADEENRWILDVSLEDHFLRAVKISDGSEYASVTLEVTENKDYSWTIN